MSALARFVAKVQPTDDGCWEWTGATQSHGYGSFGDGGKTHLAHRWAYSTLVAPIPAGMQIDHLCRNRRCVNPAHLEPVSAAENRRRGVCGALGTRCRQGHEMTPTNTYQHPRGNRVCVECRKRHSRDYRARVAS